MPPHHHPIASVTTSSTVDVESFALLEQQLQALQVALLQYQVNTLTRQIAAPYATNHHCHATFE
ncbi:hypothetical protein TIFTF001_041724 [Ficus carica]|uniref:Uncharacterized protein n=1 Tax=Ficus carica TaxID=3494 RepID=A0AA87ZEG0_FICCA|nr:hypothetical protein TIFTF001_041724 [Ficus carica]